MSTTARIRSFIGRNLVVVAGMGTLAFMMLPIAVVIGFSFNNPAGRYNFTWSGFTTDNWTNLCGVEGMCGGVALSLKIALLATLIATILGTLMAFALIRYRFRGRSVTNVMVLLPMTMPEVVLGASLLTLFVNLKMELGFTTILLAHVMFCLSFVVVTVRARLAGMDDDLEEAAQDLYATRWRTFRRVTLPLVLPGIAAAALISFALSFDDFIITNFTAGSDVTFPVFIWGAARRGVPPQVNVVATIMFLVAISTVILAQVIAWRRRQAAAKT
ncbi:MAG: ABC transporter permease [Solirubrobacterales bacterium]|nr:ABC transporter permease [Solirubrobacterales bacterium]